MFSHPIIFLVVLFVLVITYRSFVSTKSKSTTKSFDMVEKTFNPMSQTPPGGVYGTAECEFVVHEGEEHPTALNIAQMASNYNLDQIGIRTILEGYNCKVWVSAKGDNAQRFIDDVQQEGVLL